MSTLQNCNESGTLSRLVHEARGEDANALGNLFKYCESAMIGLVRRRMYPAVQRKFGASDIVQDLFPKVQRSFRNFRGRTAREFVAWLRITTLRQLSNRLRQVGAGSKQDIGIEVQIWEPSAQGLPDKFDSPSKIAVANEESEMLARALAQLSERQHQVIIWRNYDRLSFAEIGKNLNCSTDAARKLSARTIERLKRLMENPDARS